MKKIIIKFIIYIVLVIVALIWFFPIFWIFINSFKSTQSIISKELIIFFKPTFEHYKFIFTIGFFKRYLLNSIVVSTATTIISILAGSLTAYSLARFNTGGKNYALWVLSTRMVPPAIMILPYYIIFRELGILNTWYVLIIAYVTFNLSFVVWVMKGFFEEVPVELEEAGLIDGASRLEVLRYITFPLAKTGMIATSIFCLVFSWNEFLFALVLSVSKKAKTLPVAANDFITGYAINWGPLFSSGMIIIIPVVIFTLIVQKHIMRGLTLGALK